jgi:desulfoferrodoxin (superoxide reductase-like protein)
MDANTIIVISVQVGGFIATVATLKNDINWLKVIINKQDERIKKLEEKLC